MTLRGGPLAKTGLVALVMGTLLLAALVDLLPLPKSLAPSVLSAVFFFWTVHRPDLLSAPGTFAVGLALDAAAGLPPGMTSLALLVARTLLLSGEGALRSLHLAGQMLGCGGTALLIGTVRWLAACAFWGHVLPVRPLLTEALLTLLVYPVIAWALTRPLRFAARHAHAPGSRS